MDGGDGIVLSWKYTQTVGQAQRRRLRLTVAWQRATRRATSPRGATCGVHVLTARRGELHIACGSCRWKDVWKVSGTLAIWMICSMSRYAEMGEASGALLSGKLWSAPQRCIE